jgi:hypothetical protein
MVRGANKKVAPPPARRPSQADSDEEARDGNKKKKRDSPRAEEEDGQEEVHEEEEDDRRKPSASRQWQVAASGKMGKRAAKQTTLQFAIRVEAAGGDPVAAVAEHVPSAVDGSGLDVVVRASERALALDVAANERQGGSKKKKRGHQLNPALKNHAGAKSACWVFFREAKEGESKEFVYCIACEYLDNGAAPNAADRIRINHYGKDDAKLHAGNAMSHLKQHKAWWESVKDGASKGFNAQILFADLVKGKKRRGAGASDADRICEQSAEAARPG